MKKNDDTNICGGLGCFFLGEMWGNRQKVRNFTF